MEVRQLSRKDKSEVVSVLKTAFREYPVMRYVLRTTGEAYEKQLEALVDFFCEVRFIHDWPVLGIFADGTLVASALVNEPFAGPVPLPQPELEQLREVIGEEAHERNMRYEEESNQGEPSEPHHFLGMIGVLPEHQGNGYARDLLNSVKEMALRHPESRGICLNTEDKDNLTFYRHFGYEVISEFDVVGLHSWCMFLRLR